MNLTDREIYTQLFEEYQPILSQTQKQVMHLYLIEDLSLVEIAEIMATTRQAINDALKKAQKKLDKFK